METNSRTYPILVKGPTGRRPQGLRMSVSVTTLVALRRSREYPHPGEGIQLCRRPNTTGHLDAGEVHPELVSFERWT